MLHILFVNNMVIVSSNRKLLNESKDDNDIVNSKSETFTVCPLCKSDNAIITDPKSGEVICSKCGMVVSDKIQETRQESRTFLNNEAEDTRRIVSNFSGPLWFPKGSSSYKLVLLSMKNMIPAFH